MTFADFPAVERYLNSLINYEHAMPLGGNRTRLKLEPVRAAAARMRLPLSLPNCVHVAGTKGKGSLVHFLEALLAPEAAILTFTSPHLVFVKERVRMGGQLLDDLVWQEGISEIASCVGEQPALRLSYFETLFLFFLWCTQKFGTRWHVVEVGLGGKLDATNVLEDTRAVLMPVDFDHTEILGHTLAEIAADKAGIVKLGSEVIVAPQHPEVRAVFRRAVAEAQAHAIWFGEDFFWERERNDTFTYADHDTRLGGLRLRVLGTHQRDNAAVAIRAARSFCSLPADIVRTRLATCVIPGRQQLLAGTPPVLLDVAHNPVSFRALAETLHRDFGSRKILAVMGLMKDKDARGCLNALANRVHEILLVELPSPRSARPEELLTAALATGMKAALCTREEAFSRLHEAGTHDLALVIGSFYLAGEYLRWRQRAGIA